MLRKDPLRKAATLGVAALGVTLYWQWLNVAPAIRIPDPVLPSPNAHDAFYAAAKLEKNDKQVSAAHVADPPKGDHVYTAGEKAALVAENAPALDALRQALPMPYWNPPVRSMKTLMPEFAKYRALARLLLLESQVRAERGDKAGAMGSCLDSVEMGIKIPRGGVVIAALVGEACETIGEKPMWALIDRLSGDEAAAAANRLESLTAQRVPFPDTIREEKWYGLAVLSEAFRNKSTFAAYEDVRPMISQGSDDEHPRAAQTIDAYKSLLTHSKRRIVADYSAMMDACIERSRKPVRLADVDLPVATDPFNLTLAALWSPPRFKDAQARLQSGLLLSALALRTYKCRHGAYPAALADLVSDGILRQVPKDPYASSSETSFGYRRDSGDKYTLYSVGMDGIDDGGRPVDLEKIMPSGRAWPEKGDIGDWVAGVNIGNTTLKPTLSQ